MSNASRSSSIPTGRPNAAATALTSLAVASALLLGGRDRDACDALGDGAERLLDGCEVGTQLTFRVEARRGQEVELRHAEWAPNHGQAGPGEVEDLGVRVTGQRRQAGQSAQDEQVGDLDPDSRGQRSVPMQHVDDVQRQGRFGVMALGREYGSQVRGRQPERRLERRHMLTDGGAGGQRRQRVTERRDEDRVAVASRPCDEQAVVQGLVHR